MRTDVEIELIAHLYVSSFSFRHKGFEFRGNNRCVSTADEGVVAPRQASFASTSTRIPFVGDL